MARSRSTSPVHFAFDVGAWSEGLASAFRSFQGGGVSASVAQAALRLPVASHLGAVFEKAAEGAAVLQSKKGRKHFAGLRAGAEAAFASLDSGAAAAVLCTLCLRALAEGRERGGGATACGMVFVHAAEGSVAGRRWSEEEAASVALCVGALLELLAAEDCPAALVRPATRLCESLGPPRAPLPDGAMSLAAAATERLLAREDHGLAVDLAIATGAVGRGVAAVPLAELLGARGKWDVAESFLRRLAEQPRARGGAALEAARAAVVRAAQRDVANLRRAHRLASAYGLHGEFPLLRGAYATQQIVKLVSRGHVVPAARIAARAGAQHQALLLEELLAAGAALSHAVDIADSWNLPCDAARLQLPSRGEGAGAGPGAGAGAGGGVPFAAPRSRAASVAAAASVAELAAPGAVVPPQVLYLLAARRGGAGAAQEQVRRAVSQIRERERERRQRLFVQVGDLGLSQLALAASPEAFDAAAALLLEGRGAEGAPPRLFLGVDAEWRPEALFAQGPTAGADGNGNAAAAAAATGIAAATAATKITATTTATTTAAAVSASRCCRSPRAARPQSSTACRATARTRRRAARRARRSRAWSVACCAGRTRCCSASAPRAT